ncbi:MAG: DUF3124 domain-containing protein [Arcobacteraceae bacterium]|jgi:hypothetical protein|nr:DUF3124 domain-containing protein [Arcobacteraceae bacterium]
MKKSFIVLNSCMVILLILFSSGCDEDYQKQQDMYKYQIDKRKENNQEHFYTFNKQIDDTLERKTFYVPVYSHIYTSENSYIKMSITLSIRNTDFLEDLYVENVSYYNTEGKLVKNYISKPHVLKHMGSIDFIVDLEDMNGGNGAKFLVKLASKSKSSIPITQAIMIYSVGNNNFAFVTEGTVIK